METKPTTQAESLVQGMRGFTGGLGFYRHQFNRNIIYSEGVQYLAEEGQAYWLIDAIASYYITSKMRSAMAQDERLESMHFWTLTVKDERGVLVAQADSGEPAFIKQKIPYTDFLLDEVRIWAGFDGRHWVLYLPSEH